MMYADYLGTELLVVFDQHAAHERVRLEQFTKGTWYFTCDDSDFHLNT